MNWKEFCKHKGGTSGKVITVIVVLVMLALSGLLVWNVTHADKLTKSVTAQLGQLEGKTNDEIIAALNRVVEDGQMCISINANPTFASGTSAGTLRIENNPNNRYAQVVVITRDDTGETIYHSGLIDPNYHVQEDVLAVHLDAGDYPCTATFTAYDTEQSVIGTAAAKITITVLS